MITTGAFYSAVIQAGQRIISLFQHGPKTTYEVAPFGDDSQPLQGITAIYADTQNDLEPVIIGYINPYQMAGPGEKRFYSMGLDENGNQKILFYTWMKGDGTYELGGDIDNSVRWAALNEALQLQVEKLQQQLILISAGIATAGGAYTPGDISLDISAAKIDEIKTL